MKLTLIHPCVGRRPGQAYIGSWQMEPLPPALIAGLTPADVTIKFYDDRLEAIPFDEPTDLVALSVETYTARRAYQIASEYRRRRVPVVMGGFHATLCPEEVALYAESVVVGEAEEVWPRLIDDFRHNRLAPVYHQPTRPSLQGALPDRRIFRHKRYLSIGLVETTRGCPFKCDFCAVQTAFQSSQTRRATDEIMAELVAIKPHRKLIFFTDDNFTAYPDQAKEFLRAIIPLRLRWVSQAGINVAYDEELLELLVKSGCQGLLIGFESLNRQNLMAMNKGFNMAGDGYSQALANLRRHRIRLYATFVFGYDWDTPDSFTETVTFAKDHRFYIAAFNHLTPFPGTPLYRTLAAADRLLYQAWWLDEAYSYNRIPFQPRHFSPEELQRSCLEARRSFFSLPGILRRSLDPVNRDSFFMFRHFFLINGMLRHEIGQRDIYPLGDAGWQGDLLKV